MSRSVKITYVNEATGQNLPKVFLFMKNEVPAFDALRDGVVWRVMEDVGRGSSREFDYPIQTSVRASWSGNTCRTALLEASIGGQYTGAEDETGITLVPFMRFLPYIMYHNYVIGEV